jgi:hypothetical protein
MPEVGRLGRLDVGKDGSDGLGSLLVGSLVGSGGRRFLCDELGEGCALGFAEVRFGAGAVGCPVDPGPCPLRR